jgi:hypothetical protein
VLAVNTSNVWADNKTAASTPINHFVDNEGA